MKTWTTAMRYAAAGPLAAIALTAASVSACGGTSSGTSTIDVCKLVPSSQVTAITRETVVQAIPEQPDSFPDPNSFLCTYHVSGQDISMADELGIQIEVEMTNSPDAFAANSTSLDAGGATPTINVSGVGDKAVASANGLAVLTDKDNIVILNVSDRAKAVKLARILISALG